MAGLPWLICLELFIRLALQPDQPGILKIMKGGKNIMANLLDNFKFKTDPEIKKIIFDFWEDLEYLVKLRILLKAFPGYSITKLEERGIEKMWKSLSVEDRKDIYNNQFRYKISGQ